MCLVILATILFCQSATASFIDANLNKICTNNLETVDRIANITSLGYYINSLQSHVLVNTGQSDELEDGFPDFKGLSKKFLPAHSVEEYDVVTEDGYILKIFRIPTLNIQNHRSTCITENHGKAVLVSHGLVSSSDDFYSRGKNSLIYMLAQQGFDIWAMNYRGNRYSRRHEVLNPDIDADFWEYSMQEFGYYDLAAVIDYILKKTGETSLSFVGHSEACAALFILASQKPEYNDKINVAVALAPACYLTHSGVGMRRLVELGSVIDVLLTFLCINEMFGYNSLARYLLELICSEGEVGYKICVDGIMGILSGYEFGNIEREYLYTLLEYFPAGTSRRNLVHYSQIGTSGRFAKYDLGDLNRATYGSDVPPEYDLQKVTTKVALVAAKNDQIVGVKDVEKLRDQLSNVISYYEVNYDTFTHLDYIWGWNAHEVLYPYVIDVLNNNV